MLAREQENAERNGFDTVGLHAVVLAEVESIVNAMRSAGRADPSLLEFLQGHVRRFVVALKVVHGDAETRPEYEAARQILSSIDEMLGAPAIGGPPDKDEELLRRFLEAEDGELLSLHLLQAQEEIDSLRSHVDGLRRAAGSAIETSKTDDERIQRLLKERTAILSKAGSAEDDMRALRRKLGETEQNAAREEEAARDAFSEMDSRRRELETDIDASRREAEEIRVMLLATKGELATTRQALSDSVAVVSELSGELADAKRLMEVPDRPPHPPSRAPPSDPTEPADVAPLQRRIRELESKLEAVETAKAAISSDADSLRKEARRAGAENAEFRKRAVAWQARLPEVVREKALQIADAEKRQLSTRISELGGRDAVLKTIEASHLVLRSPAGPVVVPRAVAKNLGIAPGSGIRIQVEGGTVRFAKL